VWLLLVLLFTLSLGLAVSPVHLYGHTPIKLVLVAYLFSTFCLPRSLAFVFVAIDETPNP
jgi:hypothetical protein